MGLSKRSSISLPGAERYAASCLNYFLVTPEDQPPDSSATDEAVRVLVKMQAVAIESLERELRVCISWIKQSCSFISSDRQASRASKAFGSWPGSVPIIIVAADTRRLHLTRLFP
jgi:hypothetical protein